MGDFPKKIGAGGPHAAHRCTGGFRGFSKKNGPRRPTHDRAGEKHTGKRELRSRASVNGDQEAPEKHQEHRRTKRGRKQRKASLHKMSIAKKDLDSLIKALISECKIKKKYHAKVAEIVDRHRIRRTYKVPKGPVRVSDAAEKLLNQYGFKKEEFTPSENNSIRVDMIMARVKQEAYQEKVDQGEVVVPPYPVKIQHHAKLAMAQIAKDHGAIIPPDFLEKYHKEHKDPDAKRDWVLRKVVLDLFGIEESAWIAWGKSKSGKCPAPTKIPGGEVPTPKVEAESASEDDDDEDEHATVLKGEEESDSEDDEPKPLEDDDSEDSDLEAKKPKEPKKTKKSKQ